MEGESNVEFDTFNNVAEETNRLLQDVTRESGKKALSKILSIFRAPTVNSCVISSKSGMTTQISVLSMLL